MEPFAPNRYGPVFAELLPESRLAPLGPGTPNRALRARLEALTVNAAFAPEVVRDADMAACCLAGLWLYHDFLEESHAVSQRIETPNGSYWHGLMHRREPDYGNAKYWFRRIGLHPVFPAVREAAAAIALEAAQASAAFLQTQAAWDPFAFIDLCEATARGQAPCEPLCRRIQHVEWQLLFDDCYRRAVARRV